MTYKEYKEVKQKGVNALPIFFAFSKDQFKEEMEKRGLTMEDTDKICSIGAGGYCLRSDVAIIRAFFSKKDELPDLMKNYEFAEDAFFYEMVNTEYGYNSQADYDVCRMFGECEFDYQKDGSQYLKDMGYGEDTIRAYRAAEKKYYKNADF